MAAPEHIDALSDCRRVARGGPVGQLHVEHVMVGGGGWGALVFESPAAPGVVYFKDDCSSIYRLDTGRDGLEEAEHLGKPARRATVQDREGVADPAGQHRLRGQ